MRYKVFILVFTIYFLKSFLKAFLPNNIFFIISVKISRRALKLKTINKTALLKYIKTVIGAAQ